MPAIKELSVENIRGRMIKNAGRILDIEGDDIESTFDPLVAMLIEACAYELSKVNNEIVDSQSRILERLAQVLSPETYTGAQPAYAIAHARSAEPETTLSREVQFYAQQKSINADQKETISDIYFSPASRVTVFDADVRYMAVGKSIYEYKTPSSKMIIAEEKSGNELEPFHVWAAIDINKEVKSLNNLVFYFDWKNEPEKNDFLSLLPLTKWFYGDENIAIVKGIDQPQAAQLNVKSIAEQYDVSARTEKFVTSFFEQQFLTIKSNTAQPVIQKWPQELEEVFSKENLSKITTPCVWVKIIFPGAIKLHALNDMYISINAFPVINRRVNKITYQLRNNLNIVPLKTEETFFDMINIQNAEGNFFKSNPLESGFKNDAGFYTLRYGGIERFDKRTATEFLNTTLDLLRDESAAFSSLGNDFINSYLNQIQQAMAMIENRMETKAESTLPSHFVLINPISSNENVFIKYWSTNGVEGNQVKPATKLNLSTMGGVHSANLQLLTSSTGGKNALNENEKIMAFKRAILTHDRIVTEEDITTFCQQLLNNRASNIKIKKGWQQSPLPNEGVIRIIEVHITPRSSQKISDEDWQHIAKELQTKIENSSSGLIPIKVVIAK